MEKLVLIDGNSLINRAFYAMPLLTTKDGVYTNAVYGFMNMFFKILSDEEPTYAGVAFDMKAPTFRHGMYEAYKGTRKPMPEELRPQVPLLKDLLRLMGIAVFEKAGYEADDIIGTIAKKTHVKTLIYTGDKDSFQLVDEETEVRFTKRGITDTERYALDNFTEKTGLTPSQIIDLKSLMGDSSDNIPGVPGVGEKTALSLLQKYSTAEGVYEHIEELTGKLKEKIETSKDLCFLSKKLATINADSPIPFSLDDMRINTPFSAAVKKRFAELEFKSLVLRENFFVPVGGTAAKNAKEPPQKANFVKIEDLSAPINFDLTAPLAFALTGEGAFLSDGKTETFMPVRETLMDEGFTLTETLKYFSPVLENAKKLVVYDKKELRHTLKKITGKELTDCVDDVALMNYLGDFTGGAEKLYETLLKFGKDEKTPATSMLEVYGELKTTLEGEGVYSLYSDLELPLADVLYDMEVSGFKVDAAAMKVTGDEYRARLCRLEEEIKTLTDEPNLNLNSPKQLGEALFGKLKIGKGKKTKTGYSTTAEVLTSLEGAHPVVPLVLEYRKIQKLLSTYIDGFKKLIEPDTGIIRTSFNQTVTSTGRLSSKEPNLQNIPVRDEEGKILRKFFVPKAENRILVDADYSQIELRLLAAFSGAKGLTEAFLSGKDVHAATAAKVFHKSVEEVTSEERSKAKAVNFGIIYGISEYGLAKNLKIPVKEAKEYIDSYFATYPEVKEYMEKNVAFAKKTGYAETVLKRRRYIKELSSPNFTTRSFGERAAMNMPLQGSSADIIKLAMLGVARRLKKEGLKSELILQVHDELIIDAYEDEKERVENLLKEEMENAVKLSVPLTVSLSAGKTWFDAK